MNTCNLNRVSLKSVLHTAMSKQLNLPGQNVCWSSIKQDNAIMDESLAKCSCIFGRSLLNRTFPATPGPTQLQTSVGVGGEGERERTALYFQLIALFYDATQGASHRSRTSQEPSRDVVSYTTIIICLVIQGSSQEKRRRQRWLTKHKEGLRARETSGMPADDCQFRGRGSPDSTVADKANSTELSREGIELAWYFVIAGRQTSYTSHQAEAKKSRLFRTGNCTTDTMTLF